jgi:hypothetical protein
MSRPRLSGENNLFSRIQIPVCDIAFGCVFEEQQVMLDQDP